MPTTTLSPLIPISAIFFLFFKYLHSCISVISRICFSPAHLYKQSWREKNRRKIRKNKKKTIWNYTPKTRNSTKRRLLTWLFSSHSLSLHCFSLCVCRLCTRYYYYYYMFFSLLFSVCFPACYIYMFFHEDIFPFCLIFQNIFFDLWILYLKIHAAIYGQKTKKKQFWSISKHFAVFVGVLICFEKATCCCCHWCVVYTRNEFHLYMLYAFIWTKSSKKKYQTKIRRRRRSKLNKKCKREQSEQKKDVNTLSSEFQILEVHLNNSTRGKHTDKKINCRVKWRKKNCGRNKYKNE